VLLHLLATAYCLQGYTATGLPVRPGIVAVDTRVIPLHSHVLLHGRMYTAEDTGVIGDRIDLYTPSCRDATAFGAQRVTVSLLVQKDMSKGLTRLTLRSKISKSRFRVAERKANCGRIQGTRLDAVLHLHRR